VYAVHRLRATVHPLTPASPAPHRTSESYAVGRLQRVVPVVSSSDAGIDGKEPAVVGFDATEVKDAEVGEGESKNVVTDNAWRARQVVLGHQQHCGTSEIHPLC